MKRREFLQTSLKILGGLSMMPHILLAQNKLEIWGPPALISLSIAVAIKQGKAQNIMPLVYKEWRNPDQLRAGFAGDFILSASPINVGANLYAKGIDVRMLNILTHGLNYIFTKDKTIKNLKDLEGKKIIVPFKNDLPDIVFSALCKANDIRQDKINITYVQTPPEAVMLFIKKGEFDAVLAQEPMASSMELAAKKNGVSIYRAIDVQNIWAQSFPQCHTIPQAGLIVRGEFYDKNKEFFIAFNEDLQEALMWILSNQDSAAKFGSKYLPIPQPAIKAAIPYANLVVEKCSNHIASLEAFFKIIYEVNPNLIGGKMPPKSLYL